MTTRGPVLSLGLLLLVGSACGASAAVDAGGVDASGDDSGPVDAGSPVALPTLLPACAWPADLDDGGTNWQTDRAFTGCAVSGGAALCLSDGLTDCLGDPLTSAAHCVDFCAADQYAVSVPTSPVFLSDGGLGARLSPNLPSTCTDPAENPSSDFFVMCCPCP